MDACIMFDISKYVPGRFAYFMNEPFVNELWKYCATHEHVRAMLGASESGQVAILPLLAEIETRFWSLLISPDYPQEEIATLVNNMIKQILELCGYELIACGRCPAGRIIKSSGLYRKK